MRLTTVQEKFILHWGEMGTRWGITRSMAQIQALLLLSPDPLNAEEIASTLSMARSNVSISLRDLQAWGIVKVAHVLGDRRDHFETIKDPWALFRVILEERKRRELDPTIAALRECVEGATEEDSEARERIAEMLEFFELTSAWYRAVGRLPDKTLVRFVKLGDRVGKVLGLDEEG